jgi:hypothetical protein
VSIAVAGSFRVDVTATPSATGTFTNPTGGPARVDPNNNVAESNENNNDSNNDSVVVTPILGGAAAPIPTLSEWALALLALLLLGLAAQRTRRKR